MMLKKCPERSTASGLRLKMGLLVILGMLFGRVVRNLVMLVWLSSVTKKDWIKKNNLSCIWIVLCVSVLCVRLSCVNFLIEN